VITAALATFVYVACLVLLHQDEAPLWKNLLLVFYTAFGGTVVLKLWGAM